MGGGRDGGGRQGEGVTKKWGDFPYLGKVVVIASRAVKRKKNTNFKSSEIAFKVFTLKI